MNFFKPLVLFLALFGFASDAFATKMATLPATYLYYELMPKYSAKVVFKATKPCEANTVATLVSDEWKKETEVTSGHSGKKLKIPGRSYLVRQSCEPAKAGEKAKALEFGMKNDTPQVEHVHLLILDGLEQESFDSTK